MVGASSGQGVSGQGEEEAMIKYNLSMIWQTAQEALDDLTKGIRDATPDSYYSFESLQDFYNWRDRARQLQTLKPLDSEY